MSEYRLRYYYATEHPASGTDTASGERKISAASKDVALSMLFARIDVDPYIVFFVEGGKEISTGLNYYELAQRRQEIRKKK